MSGYREFDDLASSHSISSSFDSAVSQQLNDVNGNVQHFCKNVSTLENKLDDIDTRRDTPALRDDIIHLVRDTAELAKITNSSVKRMRLQSKQLSGSDRVHFDGLMNKFASAGIKFQGLQKMATDLEQEMITRSRIARQRAPSYSDAGSVPSNDGFSDKNPFAGDDVLQKTYEERARQEAQLQAQAEAEAALLQVREHDMRQLEHDIVDINDIFRDLGTMVHEQGDLVDHIEANVEVAATRVESGNEQLRSAVSAKRLSRKVTVAIVVIVVLVVVAVIIVALIIMAALKVFNH